VLGMLITVLLMINEFEDNGDVNVYEVESSFAGVEVLFTGVRYTFARVGST
jgi:hypothetical protein